MTVEIEEHLFYSLCDLVLPGQTNSHGTLFGGMALAMMDKAAAIVALKHAKMDVVTAAMESVAFENPIYEAEMVEVVARLVKVGSSSMHIEVDLFGENPKTGERRKCTTGKFVMVAIGPDKTPATVPSILTSLPDREKKRILDEADTFQEWSDMYQQMHPKEKHISVPERFVTNKA
jgi:acyl-CoA hydrolase